MKQNMLKDKKKEESLTTSQTNHPLPNQGLLPLRSIPQDQHLSIQGINFDFQRNSIRVDRD
jgi:hypothetical protein